MTHIRADHVDAVTQLSNTHAEDVMPANVLVCDRAINVHVYMELTVLTLRPTSFCEREVMKCHETCGSLSDGTMLKNMQLLSNTVEENISTILPRKLALDLGG